MRNLGLLLLAIWLITMGLFNLLDIRFASSGEILGALALVSGILILLDQRKVRFTGNMGMTLLSIWLIVSGASVLLNLSFSFSDAIMALLAIGAGVLLLLKR